MIHITDLHKHHAQSKQGPIGLNGVNLRVDQGDIFGVIGQSGAGKSTLIRAINGLEQATHGHIFIDGVDITQLRGAQRRAQRRQMAMVFQHFNLLSSQTVWHNIALPLKLLGTPMKHMTDRITKLLELTGLSHKRDAYPAQLSGGQKQRVAIARALVNQPKLLLCDEPTSALDPQTTLQILDLLQTINATMGLTILLITHALDVVKTICNQVAVLDQGRVVESGSLINVFTNPQHPTTQALVNHALHMDLPPAIQHTLSPKQADGLHPLLRISFVGSNTTQPFLSQMTQTLGVSFNILQAHIDHLQGQPVGFMLAQALADEATCQLIQQHAQQHGFHVEVLGYA